MKRFMQPGRRLFRQEPNDSFRSLSCSWRWSMVIPRCTMIYRLMQSLFCAPSTSLTSLIVKSASWRNAAKITIEDPEAAALALAWLQTNGATKPH